MKANYGLPEIWFTDEDEAKLQDIAAALEAGGLNTVLVAGSDLVEIPGQNPVESFAFTDEGLQLDRDDSEWTVAYDTPAIAVHGRPRIDIQERKAGRSVASQLSSWGRLRGLRRPSSPDAGLLELGALPFLDLYVPSDTGPLRISIVQEITGFSLLPENLPHGLSAMQKSGGRVRESIRERIRRSPLGGHEASRITEGGDGGSPRRASTDRILFRYPSPGRAARLLVPGSEGPPPGRPLIATRVSHGSVADLLRHFLQQASRRTPARDRGYSPFVVGSATSDLRAVSITVST